MVEFCSQKYSPPPKTGSPSIVDSNNNKNDNKQTDDGEKTEQPLLPTNNETKREPSPVEQAIQPDQRPATVADNKVEPKVVRPIKPLVVVVNGRDILNLDANLRDSSFKLRYTDLPEKNMNLFFANRSQYHRLGANGHVQEYTLVKCNCCDFEYPINGYLTPNNNNINNNNNVNLSTAINNNFMGNNIANNAKNMINNVANTNANNNNVNNMMHFGNNYNQQQLNNNSNRNSYMNYQNMKTASPYYNNPNNNMMNNNSNSYNMMNNNNSNNARMLSQQFNKNMAPTYGLYKHF
jgi:hypothetical protein